jgi:hypothetical protein
MIHKIIQLGSSQMKMQLTVTSRNAHSCTRVPFGTVFENLRCTSHPSERERSIHKKGESRRTFVEGRWWCSFSSRYSIYESMIVGKRKR